MAIEQYKCRCSAICKGKIEDCVHPDDVHCIYDFPTGFDGEDPTSGVLNGKIVDKEKYEQTKNGGNSSDPYGGFGAIYDPNDPNYIGSDEYINRLVKDTSTILDPNRPKPKPNIIEFGWLDRDDDYHTEYDKYNVCGHVKKYDANIHVRRKIR